MMTETDIQPGGNFFDGKNFPYGFSRHGEFTTREADDLQRYGRTLQALANGERKAETNDERHFLRVCRGTARPRNSLERVWLKYQGLVSRKTAVCSFSMSERLFHGADPGGWSIDDTIEFEGDSDSL